MDIHSHGGDILHSWGDDTNQSISPGKNFTNPAWNGKRGLPGDAYGEYIGASDVSRYAAAANAVSAAIAGVRGETYAVAQSFFLPSWGTTFPTSGASDDWAFSRHFIDPDRKKVGAYTMEFNKAHAFFPTWAEMQPIIIEVDAGLVRFCLSALPKWPLASWICFSRWIDEAIWHRVWPPELWGPYGPLVRIRTLVGSVVGRVVRIFRGR